MQDNLTFGYTPHSKDLTHPADRRRAYIWACFAQIKFETENPLNSDVLILTSSANLSYFCNNSKQPIILDLVDGYLGEQPSFPRDFLRNIVRSFNGQSSYRSITYTRELIRACKIANAVVVASPEQAEAVKLYNSNVHIILDDHSELDDSKALKEVRSEKESESKYIFWEGFGYTLKHFKILNEALDQFLTNQNYKLLILTNLTFARWGGYIGKIETTKLIKKWFPLSFEKIEIIPWTIDNVINNAAKSDFAIIPVDISDRFAELKPENKLMSMWHLGLPTLFSGTRAYKRVADEVEVSSMCVSINEWDFIFSNIDLQNMRKSMVNIDRYISRNHTNEILVSKWQEVIDSVLEKK